MKGSFSNVRSPLKVIHWFGRIRYNDRISDCVPSTTYLRITLKILTTVLVPCVMSKGRFLTRATETGVPRPTNDPLCLWLTYIFLVISQKVRYYTVWVTLDDVVCGNPDGSRESIGRTGKDRDVRVGGTKTLEVRILSGTSEEPPWLDPMTSVKTLPSLAVVKFLSVRPPILSGTRNGGSSTLDETPRALVRPWPWRLHYRNTPEKRKGEDEGGEGRTKEHSREGSIYETGQ